MVGVVVAEGTRMHGGVKTANQLVRLLDEAAIRRRSYSPFKPGYIRHLICYARRSNLGV